MVGQDVKIGHCRFLPHSSQSSIWYITHTPTNDTSSLNKLQMKTFIVPRIRALNTLQALRMCSLEFLRCLCHWEGGVTVSFSMYLSCQAMRFFQRSTHFSKTCCRPLITSKFLASGLHFHGWKSPEIAWGAI
jgi:hypothetical protein